MPVDPGSASIIANIVSPLGSIPISAQIRQTHPLLVVPALRRLCRFNIQRVSDRKRSGPYPVPPTAPIERVEIAMCSSLIAITDALRDVPGLFERERSELDFRVGSVFNLNSDALAPAGWTSADARACDFPGLVDMTRS